MLAQTGDNTAAGDANCQSIATTSELLWQVSACWDYPAGRLIFCEYALTRWCIIEIDKLVELFEATRKQD